MRLMLTILVFLLSLTGCQKKSAVDENNNRVFYEIFVSSFSDSNNDGIGDLKGIINRIDYLNDGNSDSKSSLGVEGIWLTPIFKSNSYHRYDVIDYYAIDDELGTMDDLDQLIEECHARGVKVILDLALNHTSDQCEWFKNFISAHQTVSFNDRYYNYYTCVEEGKIPMSRTFYKIPNTTQCYEANFVKEMPELNFDCQYVRDEILDISRYYLAKGVDGFRFDAAKYIYYKENDADIAFWKWYTDELKKIKKDVYIVMEVWSDSDEVSEYSDVANCFDFDVANNEGLVAQTLNGFNIYFYTDYVMNRQQILADKGSDRFPVFFLSNHDMDRSAEYLSLTTGKAYMAANLYILTPGSPFIYYGEEIGMKGARGKSETDADRRLAMLWGDGDTIKDPDEATYSNVKQINGTVHDQLNKENSLLNHYIKLISLRKNNPALAKGTYRKIDMNNQNLGAFEITYKDEKLYLIHNNSSSSVSINTDMFKSMIDYVGFKSARYEKGELQIGPYTSILLK